MRKLVIIATGLIFLGIIAVLSLPVTRFLISSTSFVEKAAVDRSVYFRLKVDFTYRGEPKKFDIVVGCSVLNIRYKDGSGTYEPGMTPTVYGQRMSDGKAVVVRPPDACRGSTTANGEVPRNFLPVMIVYDDTNTMGFGTAYMSDEAYDSPYSLMTFGKATIEKATREEFIDFRENGPPNAVTRSQYHSVQWDDTLKRLGLKRSHPAFGWHCYAYSRWKLNAEQQAIVRKYWPANRPKYWTLTDRKQLSDLGGEIADAAQTPGGAEMMRDDGRIVASGGGSIWDVDWGAMRRDGSARAGFSLPHLANAASLYPAGTTMSQNKWPELPDERAAAYATLKSITTAGIEVDGGKKRGFAYCYAMEWPRQFQQVAESVPAGATVDGEPVKGVIDRWGLGADVPTIVERDQYLLRYRQYYLESTRGDV
ncbi:hypothetical protein [Rhizobium sp. LjRoot254]|uniref:hypothetical protein n=1 Tax=Rhizobium sp. LjRoot254 TaxID=3342297 RepID=UPI003ED03093